MPTTQPKDAETIVQEFQNLSHIYTRDGGLEYQSGDGELDPEACDSWLRSALASYAAHLAGVLPNPVERDGDVGLGEDRITGNEDDAFGERVH